MKGKTLLRRQEDETSMPDWLILLLVMAAIFAITHLVRKSEVSRKPS